MKANLSKLFPVLLLFSIYLQMFPLSPTLAQASGELFMVGDALPDAPELAPRGAYKVGVRTIDLVNNGQIDILKAGNFTTGL
jgi:hypothetical protein